MAAILFGILIGLVIATGCFVYCHHRSTVEARQTLALAKDELSAKIVAAVRFMLQFNREDLRANPLPNEPSPGVVEFADVNGDGENELLIQYPTGAHGCALQILVWQRGTFSELASIRVDTPVGFEIGDFDGDGRVEIRTQETDWSVGLPYVNAPRLVLLFRWTGTKFAEVSRSGPAPENRKQLG